MAHKKGQGSTKNGRDSASKRLGIKCTHGEYVHSGSIILRQRGTAFRPGRNVGVGKDDTLFAMITGYVAFVSRLGRKFVNVFPELQPAAA